MPEASPTRSIALDAMSGDRGPVEAVAAVSEAIRLRVPFERIVLVGDQVALKPLVKEHGLEREARVSIFHASEVIGMDEKPIQSLKRKKDASLVRAIELVKGGLCQGAISCGNTGALMACGTLKLRPLEGVAKPAIAAVIPSLDHHFILIDAGANPVAKPEDLVSNAILGSQYAAIVLGISRPRVGLLSIGTEEGKGNDLVLEAHAWLKRAGPALNYQGLTEGFALFQNGVDVVVCDGFTGNALLKTWESLAGTFSRMLRGELRKNPLRTMGAFLCRGAFRDLKEKLNPDRYGGAPLLGLNGTVLKAHGGSTRFALSHAIRIAGEVIDHRFCETAIDSLRTLRQTLEENPAPMEAAKP